ncbi:hypothetical protein [Embleya sp. AB8]|uniref:hypothetical protein n=1 Tax=Embleya sp. AB8 TaxID=3156304 RepID=UPI003C75A4B2
MRIKFGRRVATAAAVAALTASGVGMTAGSASAGTTYVDIYLSTSHGVGVYQTATSASPKVASDLIAPAYVSTDCWTRGQDINNQGNVWYHAYQEAYSNGNVQYAYGYVYAPYVDNNSTFHGGYLQECPW